MMEVKDETLLKRYVTGRDERAFRVLVERHVGLVHGVARRVTGNDELARDVTQSSFIRLAQRAALIPVGVALEAWLHRVTRDFAVDLVRSEGQRKKREVRAAAAAEMEGSSFAMHNSHEDGAVNWAALAPVVDEMVNRLPEGDRQLLVLRYYGGESHAVVARRLGLTEEVARKRASRALEKLRVLLGRRGIATTATALATLLPAHAAVSTPATLVTAVVTAAQGVTPLAPHGVNLYLAMTTVQKICLGGAAAVFLVSLGYATRSDSSQGLSVAVREPGERRLEAREDAAANGRARAGRALPATAAEREARLREILAMPSRGARTRELLAYLDVLPPDLYRETVGWLPEWRAGEDEQDTVNVVLSSWLKRDPVRAAEWGLEQGNGRDFETMTVLRYWGDLDAPAALAWVQATWRDPGPRDGPMMAVLSGVGQSDPAAAVKMLDIYPTGGERAKALQGLAFQLCSTRLDYVECLLDVVPAGPERSELLAWGAKSMVSNGGGERGLKELLADPEARKKISLADYMTEWQAHFPQVSLAAVKALPPGPDQNEAVRGWCADAWRTPPEKRMELLNQVPGAATPDLLYGIVATGTDEPIDEAAERLKWIKSPEMREQVMIRYLQGYQRNEPRAVAKWMEKHQAPASVRKALGMEAPSTPGKR